MFESAELGHKISKSDYKKEVPGLREELLHAQLELNESASFQVIILVGGLDGAGRGATVNLLNEWMDPVLSKPTAWASLRTRNWIGR